MNSGIMSDYWYNENGMVWMTSTWNKEIYKFDYEEKSLDYISTIPDKEDTIHLYIPLVKYKDYLYCFPDNGKNIWKYNLSDNAWECLYENEFSKFRAGFNVISVIEDKVILFSKGFGCLVYFDLLSGTIIDKKQIVEEGNEEWGQVIRCNDKMYFVNKNRLTVYCTDLKTGGTIEQPVPWDDRGLSTIAVVGNVVWLSGYKRRIYSWNIEKNNYKEFELPPDFGEYDEDARIVTDEKRICGPLFLKSVMIDNNLVFIPWRTNQMILIETSQGNMRIIDGPEEEEDNDSVRRNYKVKYTELASKHANDLIICSTKNRGFVKVDCKSLKMKKIDIKYTDGFVKNILTREPVLEAEYISFNQFLEFV